ncbi:MAG: GNAT family N-acetyltransferase [Myxococcales bacterium]|nr:GNAT family N-acetyltransferase [Myxococcales bacterium]
MPPPLTAPAELFTRRLHLRRPTSRDAEAIFAYASDHEVTRYMAWPRHLSLDDTRAFLAHADEEWRQRGAGVYLASSADGEIIGSTGLHLLAPHRALTGYLLVPRVWGQGLATELAQAMVGLARAQGLVRLEADCVAEHAASARVLEKAGFAFEGRRRAFLLAPNLPGNAPVDVRSYAVVLR